LAHAAIAANHAVHLLGKQLTSDLTDTKTKESSSRNKCLRTLYFIREKTRNAAKLDEYKKLVPASFQKHPGTFLALRGRSEVLERPQSEEIVILEFSTFEAA
jgi:hypothetical protein